MPCEWYEKDGVVIHVNRGRGGGKKQTCKFCRGEYREGKLCDFPVRPGKSCDAAMCERCAVTLGGQHTDAGGGLKRLNDTADVCPIHAPIAVWKDGKVERR